MKKTIQAASEKSKKRIRIFYSLILFLILSVNAYSQKIQTLLIEEWANNNWQNSILVTNTYDGSVFLTNSLSQAWDVNSSSWKNESQIVYTNNPDGTVNQSITQTWDGVSAWDNASRSTFTYNASKKVLTTITELWFGAIWMNYSKITNTYDGSGYLTNRLNQSWDFISSWINSSQTNYTNNSDGTVNQSITQTWNVSVWSNTLRSTFTYNGSGRVLTTVNDTWTGSAWEPSTRETIGYDGSNKVLTTQSDAWTGSAWLPSTLDTNTYDGSGYLTNDLTQTWDAGSGSWINSAQSNYTNNPDGTPQQIVFQSWDGISAWNNTERITYTYTGGQTSSKSITLKVNLEGPLSGTTMTTTLNTGGLIPGSQPFTSAPWLYAGTENVTTVPSGVVDWILVELRQADVPANATSSMIIAKRAAFLKSDGTIVDTDGTSPVQFADFTLTGGNSLFIVIRHRNHLAIMSSAGATLNGTNYSYDFTTGLSQAYGGGSGYKQIGSSFAMVSGDVDSDGNIFVSDFNNWAVEFGTTNGYYNSDADMDGNAFVSDYNNWAVNFGTTIDNNLKSAQINPKQPKPKFKSSVPK